MKIIKCTFKKLKPAFTLAEVLITLAIVGVIASLTIPALISNLGNAQEVAQLKKFYATWSQAFALVENENGGIESVFRSTMNAAQVFNVFAAKLNVIKNCGSTTGCFYNTPIKYYDGTVGWATPDVSWGGLNQAKALLADGSVILLYTWQAECVHNMGSGPLVNSCGFVWVDVTGAKEPNTYGKDVFMFMITKKGIIPYGAYDGFTCISGSGTGLGCASARLSGK